MTKIRTAEEVLNDKMKDQYDIEYWDDFKENNPNMYDVILKAHQEYAKQFLDLAAEKVRQESDFERDGDFGATIFTGDILKIKERVV